MPVRTVYMQRKDARTEVLFPFIHNLILIINSLIK